MSRSSFLGFHGQSFRDLDPGSQNFFDLAGKDVDVLLLEVVDGCILKPG